MNDDFEYLVDICRMYCNLGPIGQQVLNNVMDKRDIQKVHTETLRHVLVFLLNAGLLLYENTSPGNSVRYSLDIQRELSRRDK